MDSDQPTKKPATGKIIIWGFIALLVLLLVYEYFDITNNCLQHLMIKDWQSNLCK